MNRILVVVSSMALAMAMQAALPAAGLEPVTQVQSGAQKALVNINTATVEQLTSLPGVGPATAARIVEYREKNGGFKKVEDLMNVRGIGEKTFLKLKPLITVSPVKLSSR